jgi:hypothetical protein
LNPMVLVHGRREQPSPLASKREQTGRTRKNSRFGYLTWSALDPLFLEHKLVKHCLASTIS